MTLGILIGASQAGALLSVTLTLAVAILAVVGAAVVVAVPQACDEPAAAPELALGCKCELAPMRLS